SDVPSPLPELPLQYADYAAWQRSPMHDDRLARDIAFWRGQLEGMPQILDLPTDRPRPVRPTLQGDRAQFLLEPALRLATARFCRQEGITFFMVLLSTFQVLLARMSAQLDFGVGTLVAGRALPETESLIGALVNSLVLRARLEGWPTGRALLTRVREAC